MREGAGRKHDLCCPPRVAVRRADFDAVVDSCKGCNLGALDGAASGAEMLRQGQRIDLGVGDRVPARRKGAMGEAGCQARLDPSHFGSAHMAELDAVLCARVPSGLRGLEFSFALIDLEIAFLAQHRQGAGCGEEGF
ncbi:hypothetical protein D9M72_446210 [compost metagenome]